MPPIDPAVIPPVAVDFMNADHAEAVELANVLEQALSAGAPADVEAVDAALAALVDHTREHFLREEEAMQSAHVPVYPVHKAEHDRVIAELADLQTAWRASHDHPALLAWLTGPFPTWLVQHIATMDNVTARILAMQGY